MTICDRCGAAIEIGDYPVCRGNPEDHRGGHGSMLVGNAARIDTVAYFKNARGEIYLPGRADERTPPGYERYETNQPADVRKLMKQMDTESRMQHELRQAQEEATTGEWRRQLRSDLRQKMQSMSPRGRDFAKLAIERSNNRAKPRYSPGNHMVALEYNDSNHDQAMTRNRRTDHEARQKEVFGGVGRSAAG